MNLNKFDKTMLKILITHKIETNQFLEKSFSLHYLQMEGEQVEGNQNREYFWMERNEEKRKEMEGKETT